jgi:hypothetical protein
MIVAISSLVALMAAPDSRAESYDGTWRGTLTHHLPGCHANFQFVVKGSDFTGSFGTGGGSQKTQTLARSIPVSGSISPDGSFKAFDPEGDEIAQGRFSGNTIAMDVHLTCGTATGEGQKAP